MADERFKSRSRCFKDLSVNGSPQVSFLVPELYSVGLLLPSSNPNSAVFAKAESASKYFRFSNE